MSRSRNDQGAGEQSKLRVAECALPPCKQTPRSTTAGDAQSAQAGTNLTGSDLIISALVASLHTGQSSSSCRSPQRVGPHADLHKGVSPDAQRAAWMVKAKGTLCPAMLVWPEQKDAETRSYTLDT